MLMNIYLLCLFVVAASISYGQAGSASGDKISGETAECLDCHESVTPGIVADWRNSRHSKICLNSALQKPLLERRVSVKDTVNRNDMEVVVGCYECHGRNAGNHPDNFEHFGYNINVIVSPNDCRDCHQTEVEEFSHSKKAYAVDNLAKNPVFNTLVESSLGIAEMDGDKLKQLPSSHMSRNESCFGCHGTVVQAKGLKTIDTELGEIEVPVLTNWPNQGVGRINPDGSRGACTACHPRHSFSIEIARKPYTCGQCHQGPDVPAYGVYQESKHGNIFESIKDKFNWEAVPWVAGKDFQAPTCAVCHNSLITNNDGDIIAERTHDFGDRLWIRIFGLIYSHRQPKSGKTFEIKNSDNFSMPTTFDGETAAEYLINEDEAGKRKDKMNAVCTSCHGSSWSTSQLNKITEVSCEANQMVQKSTELMQKIWDEKIADPSNPFDEYPEKLWVEQWLFHANSIRYSTAMMGPDYAAFEHGWFNSTLNLRKLNEILKKAKINK